MTFSSGRSSNEMRHSPRSTETTPLEPTATSRQTLQLKRAFSTPTSSSSSPSSSSSSSSPGSPFSPSSTKQPPARRRRRANTSDIASPAPDMHMAHEPVMTSSLESRSTSIPEVDELTGGNINGTQTRAPTVKKSSSLLSLFRRRSRRSPEPNLLQRQQQQQQQQQQQHEATPHDQHMDVDVSPSTSDNSDDGTFYPAPFTLSTAPPRLPPVPNRKPTRTPPPITLPLNMATATSSPVPPPKIALKSVAFTLNDEFPAHQSLPLKECPECGRRFAPERLARHSVACAKQKKPRKQFDAKKMRLQGTEAEALQKQQKVQKTVKSTEGSKGTHKKRDWRKAHEDFIATIRAARRAQ